MMQRVSVISSLFVLVCLPATLFGSWSDDFDSYALGQLTPQSTWVGWGVDDDPAEVSDAQAASAPNSVAVAGGSDLVHTYSGYTSGKWTFATSMYVPSTSAGTQYFIMLNSFESGSEAWSIQLPFNMDTGLMNDDMADGTEDVPIVEDAWADLRFEIDLDANLVDSYYNGSLFSTHQWADMGNSPPHKMAIEALDLYPSGADVGVVYYDNMELTAVPEPSTLVLLIVAGLGLLFASRRR